MAIDPSLRPALRAIVDALIVRHGDRADVSLDEIGDALGTVAASYDEIEAMLRAIEAAGLRVSGPEGARGEETLRVVLDAARALRRETDRAPTPAEIAARIGLPEERVRHALALARVIAK